MSVSGPSPLGTLMVQRVEAALGVTLAQQANVATGARPDAITRPGQPDKVDPTKNPPPKEQEGARRAPEQGPRQGSLAALLRSDPDIAKLLAARNAPMTSYTASAPTSLGQAAKTILALLQQYPEAKPAITGRAPLFGQPPGQGSGAATPGQAGGTGGSHGVPGGTAGTGQPGTGTIDPRAVEALTQRAGGEGGGQAGQTAQSAGAARAAGAAAPSSQAAGSTGARGATAGRSAAGTGAGIAVAAGGATSGTLPPPTSMAGQLAHALSNALQGSGLFYESHLRDLTFGHRTLAQLRAEPQANAGQDMRAGGSESGQARGAAEGGSNTPAGQAGGPAGQTAQPASAQAAQAAQATQAAQAAQLTSTHLAGALLSLDPSTHTLVRQQLETLANQSVAWQGEAWPGAEMEWEVQRREPQEGDADQPDTWATRLKLNLPGLGEVQARLSLAGGQLVMHLNAPQGADIMADHTSLLRERLGLHGLQLSQLTISRESAETPPTIEGGAP